MQWITLDAEAGQLSAELTRRGVAADARVHVLVEIMDGEADADALPMAAIAQAGGAFDWLADEPDLIHRRRLGAAAGWLGVRLWQHRPVRTRRGSPASPPAARRREWASASRPSPGRA